MPRTVFVATSLKGPLALFFQGETAAAPTLLGDGIGCVGDPLIRLGTRAVGGHASVIPQAGDPPVSVRGAISRSGAARNDQCCYRNAATGFCPPPTWNCTNGVVLSWAP